MATQSNDEDPERFVRLLPLDQAAMGEDGWRFRLEQPDMMGLTQLAEERVFPERVNNPNANHVKETHVRLVLTQSTVRWLAQSLGELVAKMDEDLLKQKSK
jgi:hypothetical protein